VVLLWCGMAAAGRAQASQPPAAPQATPQATPPHDTTDGRLGQPLIAPGLTYAPETGFGIGVGALAVTNERRPGQRPDSYLANVLLTQRGQFTLALATDVWTRDNRWRVDADAAAIRFPNRFFGLGLTTPDTGERYTPTTFAASLSVQHAVRRRWYVGMRGAVDRTSLAGVSTAGRITTYPERDGWSLVSLGVLATYDSRDRIFAAQHGTLASLTITRADRAIGSEFVHTRLTADVREYVRVHPRVTLAAQARLDHVAGDMPFDRLPQLGGPTLLRGYFAGRFREKSLGVGQAEVRLGPWWDFVGLTVFAGAGGVAPDLAMLRDVRFRRAAGVGLRLVANPSTGLSLRVDYGRGEMGSRGWYFTVGEAF
jgi:outer membrane protein assembly factor BamA